MSRRFICWLSAVVVVLAGLVSVTLPATGASAAPSGLVTQPGAYESVTPTRLLDTRTSPGPAAPGPNSSISFQVAGRAGLPSQAASIAAVVLNVTAVTPTAGGYVTVWSGDNPTPPLASNLNFTKGQTIANLVVVPVGANGKVSIYNSTGTVQLLADVQGYYLSGTPTTAGAFHALAPTRIMDSRRHFGAPAPLANQSTKLQVLGAGGNAIPPGGVSSVILNVTVTGTNSGGGYLTVWSGTGTRPTASNLNFSTGQTVPNLVVAPVGADGKVAIFNGSVGTVQVIVDVEGWVANGTPVAAGALSALPAPKRLLDTRRLLGGTAPAGNATLRLTVLGKAGIPADGVAAVVLNVTVTAPKTAGHVTVWAGDTATPVVSNLNFRAGQTVPNLVVAPVSGNGQVAFHNGAAGTIQLVADVQGYILDAPPPVSNVNAQPSTTSVGLTWSNPVASGFTGVTIRVNQGTAAPTSPTDGTGVADTAATSFTDGGLTPGTTYTYAFFSHDNHQNFSVPATKTVTTLLNAGGPGPITAKSSSNVTTDPLATPQIETAGVVWSQVIIGNTVYVGGNFQTARPMNVAEGGSGQLTRKNMLAYDLSTGALINTFSPVFDGQVLTLAASPDGSVLYAGGDFNTVSGKSHPHIVALNPSTGLPLSTFAARTNSQVRALVATSSVVYAGGVFTTANGVAHNRAASFFTGNGAVTTWQPNADATVNALALSPDGTKIVLGGRFLTVNGTNVFGLGAVNVTTGASVTWLANQTIRDYGDNAAIESLSTDGRSIFASGYKFTGGTGNLEGVVSMDPANGYINWIEDCHGDTYDTAALNGTLYTVGHAHFCLNDGGWGIMDPNDPRYNDPAFDPNPPASHWQYQRAVAFTTQATGTLLQNSQGGYTDYFGNRAPSIINWFPDLLVGTATGQGQAAWSVAGNSQYVVLGGEFPAVNNKPQQGLARFAVSSIAPNADKPRVGASGHPDDFVPTLSNPSSGTVNIDFNANWDRDNLILHYYIIRDGDTAHPLDAGQKTAFQWNFFLTPISYVDTGVSPGSHSYQLEAWDGTNATLGTPVNINVS